MPLAADAVDPLAVDIMLQIAVHDALLCGAESGEGAVQL
jgi:hypothetical protein